MKLILQCIFCWLHGFSTKVGNEAWFKRQCMHDNNTYPKNSQRRK